MVSPKSVALRRPLERAHRPGRGSLSRCRRLSCQERGRRRETEACLDSYALGSRCAQHGRIIKSVHASTPQEWPAAGGFCREAVSGSHRASAWRRKETAAGQEGGSRGAGELRARCWWQDMYVVLLVCHVSRRPCLFSCPGGGPMANPSRFGGGGGQGGRLVEARAAYGQARIASAAGTRSRSQARRTAAVSSRLSPFPAQGLLHPVCRRDSLTTFVTAAGTLSTRRQVSDRYSLLSLFSRRLLVPCPLVLFSLHLITRTTTRPRANREAACNAHCKSTPHSSHHPASPPIPTSLLLAPWPAAGSHRPAAP